MKRNKLIKHVSAGAASLALVFALAGTASADHHLATVDGHAAATSENNNPDFWGDDCTKLDAPEGDLGAEDATYTLGASYALVVVKAGDVLTIFEDVSAGQAVFADTNENNVSDPGGKDGDKNISHIIFCDEEETSSTTSSSTTSSSTTSSSTTSSTTSFESSEESTTDVQSSTTSFSDSVSGTISQPPTDTIGNTGSAQQSGGLWMLLAVLGVLAGSVIVLAPSKAKSKS